jgi:leukotriene-A4 hydrolase
MDQHTLSNYSEVFTQHLKLKLNVLFEEKKIIGTAIHEIKNLSRAANFVLDTADLNIQSVEIDGLPCYNYSMGIEVLHLGKALIIPIQADSSEVKILYETRPDAAGIQWLDPQQTEGKNHPMVYTQSQAILARTWIPCQDTPASKITWEAEVSSDKNLEVVMSGKRKKPTGHIGAYNFRMTNKVASYLISMCIGNLAYTQLSNRCGVYAEPEIIDAAVSEFSDMDTMLDSAQMLYGDYRWETFDVLVLPYSFPFGGMENPMLTFLTPTLIAGDQSLTNVVAHELAHAWSGNLITNKTWNDFWLNEGFTVYFERRIIEQSEGAQAASLHAYLGYQDLIDDLSNLSSKPDDTKLLLNLAGRDPDDGMTHIAYEKGFFLLIAIEKELGRTDWDQFMKDYFSHFACQSISTSEFRTYLLDQVPVSKLGLIQTILDEWIDQPGLPSDFEAPCSELYDDVQSFMQTWARNQTVDFTATSGWSWIQKVLFLNGLDEGISDNEMSELYSGLQIDTTQNSEILFAWYKLVIQNNYTTQQDEMEAFIIKVGRRKFVEPLYKLLIETRDGKLLAQEIFAKAKDGYHSITRKTVEAILQ